MDIRSLANEPFHGFKVVDLENSKHQGRHALLVFYIDVRSLADKIFHGLKFVGGEG